MNNCYSLQYKGDPFQINLIKQIGDEKYLNISTKICSNENPYYEIDKEMQLNKVPLIYYDDLKKNIPSIIQKANEKEKSIEIFQDFEKFIKSKEVQLLPFKPIKENKESERRNKFDFSKNSDFKKFLLSAIEGDDILRISLSNEIHSIKESQAKTLSMAFEAHATQKQIDKIKNKFNAKTQNLIDEFEQLQQKRKINFEEELNLTFSKEKVDRLTSNNPEIEISPEKIKQIPSIRKEKLRVSTLHLCLGMQKKFKFKVKILEENLDEFYIKQVKDFGKSSKNTRKGVLDNVIFGIDQKAAILTMKEHEGKLQINSQINQLLTWRNELVFDGYKEQMEGFKEKEIIFTKHSCIPPHNIIVWLKELNENNMEEAFISLINSGVKEIFIPIEGISVNSGNFTDIGGFHAKNIQSEVENFKAYGDELKFLFKGIKRCLTIISLKSPSLMRLKKISVIVPRISKSFEISKEIARSQFE